MSVKLSRPDMISDRAALEEQSKSALKRMNELRKKGYKWFKKAGTTDEYRPVKIVPLKDHKPELPSGVRFIRKNGRIIPIRKK